MKRIAIVLLTVIMMLTSCAMKGEIYLANLKKMYPEAEITVKDEGFLITFTDLVEVYSEDIDITLTESDIKPEYQLFKGKLSGRNKHSFEFVNKEFSNHKTTVTILLTYGTENIEIGEAELKVKDFKVDPEKGTLTHGILNRECTFVTDKEYNLIGIIC